MSASSIPVITVDGPSGSGKGTLCQCLATKLGYHLLDSGALYRITALAATNQGVDLNDANAVTQVAQQMDVNFRPGKEGEGVLVVLGGCDVSRDIRQEKTGMGASIVAAYPPVREALLERQRAFRRSPGLVADGRDMGTAIFPDAPLKIFLTASAEERARRRYEQLIQRGESANLRALLEDIQKRDASDSQRAASPLRPADDAIVIESTSMSIQSVLEKVMQLAKERLPS